MIIKKLNRYDIIEIISWSTHESIKKWIFIEDWNAYFDFVFARDDYFIFGVWSDDTLIGELAAEIVDEHISIALIIKPELQGKGLGAKALNLFCENAGELTNFKPEFLHAAIEPKNRYSRRCFEKARFGNIGKDSDGELYYKRIL